MNYNFGSRLHIFSPANLARVIYLSIMALTANEQKQFQLESRAKLSKAETPMEKLRFMCLARGASGINGLGRQFRVMDDDSNRKLSKEEFTKGCNDFGCHLSSDEVDKLFAAIDTDNSGSIGFEEFLRALRPPMSQRRIDLVKKAFSLLDKSGDGVITVSICFFFACFRDIAFDIVKLAQTCIKFLFLDIWVTGSSDTYCI
ncbi:unnamed protein product [Dibothriocephalus latus]|uniref:EF-hand domain-containing protein n=1 Tax=Dibothriocephalus latus TaxID=60516 RepID=A0A3P6R7C4_DIBLA|nr:unnamed protein product [Dibothriocephalus latus]